MSGNGRYDDVLINVSFRELQYIPNKSLIRKGNALGIDHKQETHSVSVYWRSRLLDYRLALFYYFQSFNPVKMFNIESGNWNIMSQSSSSNQYVSQINHFICFQ